MNEKRKMSDIDSGIKDMIALVETQRAEIAKLREALAECEEYFDNRSDADCDEIGFIPNEEMKILTMVQDALKGGEA